MTGSWLTFGVSVWKLAGATAAMLSLPGTVELLLVTAGGVLPYRRYRTGTAASLPWKVAVVVPAHNEENSIQACIASLQEADSGSLEAEIVVVADNCSDRTAALARQSGARVLERHDPVHRGKGFALDFAFKALAGSAFDAFLIVDADTSVQRNFLLEMNRPMQLDASAVQCRYLGSNAAETTRTRLVILAQRAFNILRPRGRHNLGLSCNIYGNGFGMRREVLEAVPYLADSLVEDLEYHLDLVRSGRKVEFVDTTTVSGQMPVTGQGATNQRARWEGGRLRMVRQRAGGLLTNVLRGHLRSFEPLLDLLLLPLAFHVTLLLISVFTPTPWVSLAGLVGLLVVVAHIAAGIVVGGGGWRDVAVLSAAPFYVAWKLLLIPLLIANSRAAATWVRTERAPGKKLL